MAAILTARRGGVLQDDAIASSYHLALLERPYREHVRWHEHADGSGRVDAVAALYDVHCPTVIFLLGEAEGVGRCLADARLPDLAYVACFEGHRQAFEQFYRLPGPAPMVRMVLERREWERRARAARCVAAPAPVALNESHLEALHELFAAESGFQPDLHQFRMGRYMGIVDGGRILSAAGTHFVSRRHSIAIIGNVLTHPAHRRRGLATAVVRGMLLRLFDDAERVCLNVRRTNEAAVNLYASLGFAAHCSYIEGTALLRQTAANGR